jgi:hypothetical protein
MSADEANYCITCGRQMVVHGDQRRCPNGCPPAGPVQTETVIPRDYRPAHLSHT